MTYHQRRKATIKKREYKKKIILEEITFQESTGTWRKREKKILEVKDNLRKKVYEIKTKVKIDLKKNIEKN